jgi:hypothetical protein
MKDVFRLKREAKAALEQYSQDPNQSIIMLQNRVKMLQNANETYANAPKSGEKPLQTASFGDLPEQLSSDSYWNKLKTVVDKCIEDAKRY